MIKTLQRVLVAGGLMLTGLVSQVHASHLMGSDLTYTCVAPGLYQVQLKLYRDCSGINANNTYILTTKSQGCNAGRTFTMNKVGTPTIGNLYCPQVPITCTPTGNTNFEEHIYTTTVTFNAAEQACSDWSLSVNFGTDNFRPTTANVSGGPLMYNEAFLKLGASINNNSPQFNVLNVPVPSTNTEKPVSIAFTAVDPDGDSLSYKLVTPLDVANTPVVYKSYNLSSQMSIIANPSNPSDVAVIPASGTFSAQFPLHSYKVDWSSPIPHTVTKYFELDAQSGKLSFIPMLYVPNTQSNAGANKYTTAMQIDEFRKINGAVVKVGSIRRDILITLIDCGPNNNPRISTIVANNQPLSDTSPEINLRPGKPLTLTMLASDVDAASLLAVQSNVSSVLPGAVFNATSGAQSTISITWTPTAADVRSQPYYFNILVKDNACPVMGSHSQPVAVRVSNTGGVTGLDKEVTNSGFIAYPNPFSQEVSFKLNLKNASQTIIIYNTLGQQVDKISLAGKGIGEQSIRWENASRFASGTYVAKLVDQSNAVQTIKFSKLQ